MNIETHQKEVEKLKKIELQLAKLIADTNNNQLMDKFSEFADQRIVCNKGFADYVEEILSCK